MLGAPRVAIYPLLVLLAALVPGVVCQPSLRLSAPRSYLVEGESVNLTCTQTGTSPTLILSFLVNNGSFPVCSTVAAGACLDRPTDNCGCVSDSGGTRVYRLTLRNISTRYAGNYSCELDLKAVGAGSQNIYSLPLPLPVHAKPTLPALLSTSTVAVEGSDVTLTCSSNATTLPTSERLPLTYIWYRRGNIVSGQTGASLRFNPVSRTDDGNYTCRSREGSNRLTSELSSPSSLDVQYGPSSVSLVPPQLSHEVRETTGSVPVIRCQASCDPPCSFRWQDKAGSMLGSTARFPLSSLSRQQAGSFTCTASNKYGSQTVRVSILATYPPDVRVQPSPCAAHSTYVTLVGASVTLTCDVTAAYPSVTGYQWSVAGPELAGREYPLTVTKSSGGQYACQATNREGTSSASVTLDVQYPPEVSLSQTSVAVVEGNTVEVECHVDARPDVTQLRWSRESGSLPPGTSASSPRLELSHVTRKASGTYTCSATNRLSPCDVSAGGERTATASVVVNVQFAPSVTSLSVNGASTPVTVEERVTWTLRCDVTSNPSSTVRLLNVSSGEVLREETDTVTSERSWSAECLHRGSYSCRASNSVNASSPVTPVQLYVRCYPREDLRVHGTQTTRATSLGGNVTFTLPLVAYPSPSHTWYRRHGSQGSEQLLRAGASSSGVMASLTLTSVQQTDFGLYFLNVSNDVGTAMFTFLLVPLSPPECPRLVAVSTHSSRASLTVTWERGFNGGGAQHFLVELKEGTGGWTNASLNVTESRLQDQYTATLENLQPGRDYTVRVRAYNQFGHSCYSHTFTASSLPVCPVSVSSLQVTGAGVGVGLSLGLVVVGVGAAVFYLRQRRQGRKLPQTGGQEASRHYADLDVITRHRPREDDSYQELSLFENAREVRRSAEEDGHVYQNPGPV